MAEQDSATLIDNRAGLIIVHKRVLSINRATVTLGLDEKTSGRHTITPTELISPLQGRSLLEIESSDTSYPPAQYFGKILTSGVMIIY